jgi:hypothetical protein
MGEVILDEVHLIVHHSTQCTLELREARRNILCGSPGIFSLVVIEGQEGSDRTGKLIAIHSRVQTAKHEERQFMHSLLEESCSLVSNGAICCWYKSMLTY